ncbi:orotidine-5'-phosphate decarboxylase [Arthrobacter roseus]|uniref:orotidine-5'-phosphate decarboxylase n=1 Tax=Arthrobacter roseus TaxID=136274 RepID=UPI001965F485|nr:orotidine-5'-phosphate decarboxylase [Arthrobacter roseus]MBM7848633.1 orotidine-5'-phosphate decarboxylase [Arthrobacter roseus]
MTEREGFGVRLRGAMDTHGPVCVGIDPHPALLTSWHLNDDPAGLERFALSVVESLADRVAVLKPQVAFFERHGSQGIAVLERVLKECRERGVLTIADAKRGDIGSTMAAYADTWLGDASTLAADAVTVSPYLGFGSLRPALDLARRSGRGVFVLALTSNPDGASLQHRGGENSVARSIVDKVAVENGNLEHLANIGLVVGATVGTALLDLGIDLATMGGPILAPGIGAQGATVENLGRTFGAVKTNVLASVSREILRSGPDATAMRNVTERTVAELRAVLVD